MKSWTGRSKNERLVAEVVGDRRSKIDVTCGRTLMWSDLMNPHVVGPAIQNRDTSQASDRTMPTTILFEQS